jgi:hypothetical protein
MVKNKMDDNVYIDGPVNVIRLEGKVDGINKVLYLFADIHNSLMNQTDCNQNRSTTLNKFLVNNFDNTTSNKKYDFFLEINPDEIITHKNFRYIEFYNCFQEVSNMNHLKIKC